MRNRWFWGWRSSSRLQSDHSRIHFRWRKCWTSCRSFIGLFYKNKYRCKPGKPYRQDHEWIFKYRYLWKYIIDFSFYKLHGIRLLADCAADVRGYNAAQCRTPARQHIPARPSHGTAELLPQPAGAEQYEPPERYWRYRHLDQQPVGSFRPVFAGRILRGTGLGHLQRSDYLLSGDQPWTERGARGSFGIACLL